MTFDRISVIIPTYNRCRFLKKAVESVLGQDQRGIDVELIVVDDGSTDTTGRLLAAYGDRLRVIRQDNRGPAAARNTGIRAASHPLIAFLDSDDWFAPDKLARQLGAMARHPEFLLSHTQEIWYRQGRLLNQKKKHRKRHGFIFDHCLQLCAVSMSTVIIHRLVFDDVGFFAEDFPCCEDYDFWLRVSCKYPFLLIDAPLTLKEGGRADQVSSRFRVGMDRYRIEAIRRLLARRCLPDDLRELAVAELARKCRIYGNGCLKHGRRDEGCRYLELAASLEEPAAAGAVN